MVVYIEQVIAANMLINGLVLYVTSKCLKLSAQPLRITLASVIGTAYAVLMPLVNILNYALVKFALAAVIVAIAVKVKSFKHYLLAFIAFLLWTFALGGGITAADNVLNGKLLNAGGYNFIIIILTAVCIIIMICELMTGRAYSANKCECIIRDSKGISLNCVGLIDTGNSLAVHGENVVVLSKAFSLKISPVETEDIVTVKTVNGDSVMRVYNLGTLQFNGKEYRDVKAVISKNIGKHYQIIINKNM